MNNFRTFAKNWTNYVRLDEKVYSDIVLDFIQYDKEVKNAYPGENLEAKLTRFIKLENFLKKYFEILGCGAFRCAYQSPEGEIIKIIQGGKGIDRITKQNKLEIQRFLRTDLDIFPKIYEYDDEEYMWMILERLNMLEDAPLGVWAKLFPKMHKLIVNILKDWHGSVHLSKSMYENLIENIAAWVYGKVDPESVEIWPTVYPATSALAIHLALDSLYINLPSAPDVPSHTRNNLDYSDVSVEKHQKVLENVYSYLRDPDLNFKRILRSVKDAEINPDLHAGNYGYKEDKIYIIDVGL